MPSIEPSDDKADHRAQHPQLVEQVRGIKPGAGGRAQARSKALQQDRPVTIRVLRIFERHIPEKPPDERPLRARNCQRPRHGIGKGGAIFTTEADQLPT